MTLIWLPLLAVHIYIYIYTHTHTHIHTHTHTHIYIYIYCLVANLAKINILAFPGFWIGRLWWWSSVFDPLLSRSWEERLSRMKHMNSEVEVDKTRIYRGPVLSVRIPLIIRLFNPFTSFSLSNHSELIIYCLHFVWISDYTSFYNILCC